MSVLETPLFDNRVAVVGLGYVGLPTSIALYNSGFFVTGIDVSDRVVEDISEGKNPLSDSSSTLALPSLSERWSVTTRFEEAIPQSDIILITVPTPVASDKLPDLSFVEAAFESIFDNIENGDGKIVVLESTVYPGVTNEISSKIAESKRLVEGEDFFIAYSPERVSPGEEGRTVEKIPKIVGADDSRVGSFLKKFYNEMTDGGCSYVGSISTAEAAKLVENVQRDVDIALTNEFAIVLSEMGLDVEEVLEAASTKWSFHRHFPGIGVGGHCIPVDPYYYIQSSKKVGFPSSIVPEARKINEMIPIISAKKIIEMIGNNKDSRVLILGYSYKPELGDCRMTPVLPLINELRKEIDQVLVWDPHVKEEDFPDELAVIGDPLREENLDCIVLATAHSACINLDWDELCGKLESPKIFDGRRALDPDKMMGSGWKYSGVGFPI